MALTSLLREVVFYPISHKIVSRYFARNYIFSIVPAK